MVERHQQQTLSVEDYIYSYEENEGQVQLQNQTSKQIGQRSIIEQQQVQITSNSNHMNSKKDFPTLNI